MKLKHLEAELGGVEAFRNPKVELEQYPTSAHLAAHVVYNAAAAGDVADLLVLDLGCGGGVLGIGAALLGAGAVVGVDVDQDALELAADNAAELEVELELARCDANALPPGLRPDTVLMNPPFGTRRKGADLEFVAAALRAAGRAVWSMHKTSTRAHVKRFALANGAASADVVAQLRYDIPASYAFHKQKTKDIEVDVWRFELPPPREGAGEGEGEDAAPS